MYLLSNLFYVFIKIRQFRRIHIAHKLYAASINVNVVLSKEIPTNVRDLRYWGFAAGRLPIKTL
jgi:hypothetical protein